MKSIASAQHVAHSPNRSSNFSGTGAPPTPTGQSAPLPNQAGASLTDRLNAKARESWDMDAVVKAILKLKEKDQLPAFIDDALCQEAANVLLELGQIHLLCRLAELKPIAYVLDIGASEQKACTLGRIGVAWPVGTPVCVVLAASLPSKAVHALDAFLPYPTTVVLRVVADGVAESSEAKVEAEAQALEALVKGSGATALDVTDPSISPSLAVRLLACRGHWTTVHMRLDSAPHELLAQTQRKIDRLELHPPEGAAILAPNVAFLRTLMEKGVRTLIVHGPLDLFKLATAVQASAGLGELHLDRVEACFVVPRGADVGWTISALSRSQMIGEFQHQPMRLEMTGYAPLDVEAAQRLSSPDSLARMALRTAESAANRLGLATEWRRDGVSQTWFDAVTAIGSLLAPQQSLEALVGYVLSPANTLIPKEDWVPSAKAFPVSNLLEDKLRWLVAVKTPDALLRAALTELLQGAGPDEVESVCQTLIFMRFPLLVQPLEAWQTQSRDFTARWLSDPVSRAELNAIAVPRDLQPSRVEHEVVEPPLPRGGIAELLIPSGEEARAELVLRFRQMQVNTATWEIVRLLTTGHCNIAHMSTMEQMTFATRLLQEGQWKLLAHLVPTRRTWSLYAATSELAKAIGKLTPWPSATSECHIVVSSSVSAASVSGLEKFVQSVPSENLSLIVGCEPSPNTLVWDKLAALVLSKKGANLTLTRSTEAAFPTADVIGFLNRISTAQLRSLGLVDLIEPSVQLQQALTAFCRSSAVPDIAIGTCNESLTQAVLTCRPWNQINAPVSPTLAEVVMKDGIVAEALTLQRRGFDDLQEIEIIVKCTEGLKSLEVVGGPVDLQRLAHLLDGKRSIESVKAALSTSSKQSAVWAAALMRQNDSLRKLQIVEWDPSDEAKDRLPLDKPTVDALSDAIGLHAANQTWETLVNALADLLAPPVKLAAVTAHLNTLGRTIVLKRIKGYEPDIGNMASDQLVNKVLIMVMEGVPRTVVAEAIARRMAADPISTPRLLEALVVLRVMPSRQWLKDGFGLALADQ
ncbi:hypothetical protein [Hydrogenophaga sp.]|uniref:hypothetical protein n=1 Tax=Hydrogenophaga sp. TaxID=1904254 RepID=UPI00271C7413|nr:hypothetical protein [Hydrogenophaga sp.]MDO9438228.1 hypothetical protein [Hydrogenophaga sp.]